MTGGEKQTIGGPAATMNGSELASVERATDDAKHAAVSKQPLNQILSAATIPTLKSEQTVRDADVLDVSGQGGAAPLEKVRVSPWRHLLQLRDVLVKYSSFIGPGFLVSVAYIDPGNYATAVSSGATFRFQLLFVILLSNLIAVFLQSLCIRLGSVTGLNLAENCRAHLPKYVNIFFYVIAEGAIILTDVAEVIGTAIALNILIKVPLVAGCALAIADVLIILFFYDSDGMSMRALRIFEGFVVALVLGVVACFCFELSTLQNVSVTEVLRGFVPSSAVLEPGGLYQACGILGATVMPHSLYLGSGIVQARLKEYDRGHQVYRESASASNSSSTPKYQPTLGAINHCMKYSIIELAISLFTFALFVNSAILIVSGASFSGLTASVAADADLFTIHDLLSQVVGTAAGVIFALALLLSGTSAGLICTMAGQMVSEGQIAWKVKPWKRRLVTRCVSIVPSVVIAAAVGRGGLAATLVASQVGLSVALPIVSLPLVWFTCNGRIMKVDVDTAASTPHTTRDDVAATAADASPLVVEPHFLSSTTLNEAATSDVEHGTPVAANTEAHGGAGRSNTVQLPDDNQEPAWVVMRNSWPVAAVSVLIWLFLALMNVVLLVQAGQGAGSSS